MFSLSSGGSTTEIGSGDSHRCLLSVVMATRINQCRYGSTDSMDKVSWNEMLGDPLGFPEYYWLSLSDAVFYGLVPLTILHVLLVSLIAPRTHLASVLRQ